MGVLLRRARAAMLYSDPSPTASVDTDPKPLDVPVAVASLLDLPRSGVGERKAAVALM